MQITSIAAALSLAASAPAIAQDVCARYQDMIVAPITIQSALARFANVPTEKGEFETTAQFAARQAAAVGGAVGPIIISKEVDPQYIRYDADAQRLTIQTYLFDNANFSHDVVFGYGTPLHDRVTYSALYNTDVVISQSETPAGSYRASNAFGANVEVTRIRRRTFAVFEGQSAQSGLFANGGGPVLVQVSMPPAQAQTIKPQLRIAFVVTPRSPYIARGTGAANRPSISYPFEITEEVTVLMADIQCALLTDSGNRVLGAFPTY
jgi:hypothetical protein